MVKKTKEGKDNEVMSGDKAKDKKKEGDLSNDKASKRAKPKNAKTTDKSMMESRVSPQQKHPISGGSKENRKSLSKHSGSTSPRENLSKENLEMPELPTKERLGKKSISKNKYAGLPPEWDSNTIKGEDLTRDGFSCCIVLAAEESPELSDITQLLCQAVETGVRKRFVVIKYSEIEAKVYQFMASSNKLGLQEEADKDNKGYMDRMDIWAEAIKSSLVRLRNATELDMHLMYKAKDDAYVGVRSKELLLPQLSPLANTTNPRLSSGGNGGHSEKSDTQSGESPNSPPSDQSKSNEKDKVEGPVTTMKGKEATKSVKKDKNAVTVNPEPIGVKSAIKKRGEVPMPILEQIDDIPENGYKCYAILQGFHNVKLIPEMKKLGCPINGILLMTSTNSDKKNFSVNDVEENITGSYVPQNVLPDYITLLQHRISKDVEASSEITKFWMELTGLLNKAPSHSCLHDIALLNCPLPTSDHPLDNEGGRSVYAAQIFDEVAQRIYEMHVLLDWYKEYRQAVHVRQITPIEPFLSHSVYDRLMDQVPAECVTVPIIMECIVEQVMSNIGESRTDKNPVIESIIQKLKINLGPEWGLTAYPKQYASAKEDSRSRPSLSSDDGLLDSKQEVKPTFYTPKFIKNGDYASMRAAHLSEPFASHLASSQVTGDFHRLENVLWQGLPEFSKGFHMKLLGNLNHFMEFLPQGFMGADDMFFILHLLMSAGVEEHLQKLAEIKQKEAENEKKIELPNPLSVLINAHGPGSDVNYLNGTNLQSDHNYLTIDTEDVLHFILAPMGKEGHMTISSLGQSKNFKADTPEVRKSSDVVDTNEVELNEEEETQLVEDAEEEEDSLAARVLSPQDADDNYGRRSSLESKSGGKGSDKTGSQDPQKRASTTKRRSNTTDDTYALGKAHDKQRSVTTDGAVASSEMSRKNEVEDGEFSGEVEDGIGPINPIVERKVGESERPPVVAKEPPPHSGFGVPGKKHGRFTPCDAEFYKDLNDYSTFQSLLECPALLTIGENGGLNLNKWVDSYLDSKGLTNAAGEGVMVGQLKDWNYIEEYDQSQLIQVLSESVGNYLSLQRMYCPFYDTVLFIFNNPTPYSLESSSSFVARIQTLPGLQTFLEYTINDDDVLQWILKLEKNKGVEVVDSFSVNTLLKIVPDDQWVIAPSIKERIIRRQLSSDRQEEELEKLKNEMTKSSSESKKKDDKRKKSVKQSPDETGDKADKVSEEQPTGEKKRKSSKKEEKEKKGKNSRTDDIPKKSRKKSNEEGKKERKSSKPEGPKTEDEGSKEEKKKERKGSKKEDDLADEESNPNSNEKGKKIKARKESFNFGETSKGSKGRKTIHQPKKKEKLFECYDLGKRMVISAVDTFHLFPLDGSIIQYEMSTIEPNFRMMQLTVSKNGHQSFFYPYYIPHDLDISKEAYVICPYFHLVHSNGTIFAFQDHRAKEAAPYLRYCMSSRRQKRKFSFTNVVFAEDYAEKHITKDTPIRSKRPSTINVTETPAPTEETDFEGLENLPAFSDEEVEDEEDEEEENVRGEKKDDAKNNTSEDEADKTIKGKKGKKEKSKGKDKDKDKKKQKDKKGNKFSKSAIQTEETNKNEIDHQDSVITFQEDITGEWIYPLSEDSEDEGGNSSDTHRRHSFYRRVWEHAEKIIKPLTHSFKITVPSGLVVQISDSPGLPLGREVKQWYAAKGSASSPLESSRHYTSNGSVVKFMTNSTIQIINARGVTTCIREVSANVNRQNKHVRQAFTKATTVKVFEGDVILPTGEYWKIKKGARFYRDPLFLFSGGQLPSGEIFRRRQDGVVYLHRHDGTVICHYPDGTRFTTRMVVNKQPVDEFEDWVFVGLKFLVEHPNYATVLFNTISGNVHVKLPHGEWVRVFADSSIKVCCSDDYTLDVDRRKAILSFPPCAIGGCGDHPIPNTTVVKLFHSGIKLEENANEPKKDKEQDVTRQATVDDEEENEDIIIAPTNTAEREPIISPGRPQSGEFLRESSTEEEEKTIRRTSHDANRNESKLNVINDDDRSMASKFSGTRMNSLDSTSNKSIKSTDLHRVGSRKSISAEEFARQSNSDILKNKGQPKLVDAQTKLDEKMADIDKFLRFDDVWTFCKSVDSWENKFSIDVFGKKVIEKSEKFLAEMCVSTEKLIDTFSLTSIKQPEANPFASGLLRSTSSEKLIKMSRRITALRQSKLGDCGKLAKTKIFVVKRDLSGYQYLKQSEVDSTIRKAKSQKESIIITDVLPSTQPRKFITIMQPMDATDKPNGLWHTVYREPVFRPKILTGKQMHSSKAGDLRWFSYVVSTAHGKRPTFVTPPKDRYIQNRKEITTSREESPQLGEQQENTETHLKDNTDENEVTEGDNELEEEQGDTIESENEQSEGETEFHLADPKIVPADSPNSDHNSDSSKQPKTEARKSLVKKDSKKKKRAKTFSSSTIAIKTSSHMLLSENNDESKVNIEPLPKRDGKPKLEEYPDDVLDVEGIYDAPKITAQSHVELCSRHKSIIVRNFLEIPKIDEEIQRAIISASTSYGESVQKQLDIYKTYELDDPNFEQERKRQKFIKQQLIEQNLEDMHLYEQEQGKVLSFHF